MADLKLVPLREVLSDSQIKKLTVKLKEFGVELATEAEDAVELDESLSDDQLADFADRSRGA